jgi:hypothetical protein
MMTLMAPLASELVMEWFMKVSLPSSVKTKEKSWKKKTI